MGVLCLIDEYSFHKNPIMRQRSLSNLEMWHCHTAAHYSFIYSFGFVIFIKKQMGAKLQRAAMICTRKAPPVSYYMWKGRGDLTANSPIVLTQRRHTWLMSPGAAELALNLLFLIKNLRLVHFMGLVLWVLHWGVVWSLSESRASQHPENTKHLILFLPRQ